ncbi:MAG: FMN-binding negative transcriptional regulator [Actinomycetes bacterium]
MDVYLPKHFAMEDQQEIVDLVREVGSADFVTVDQSGQPLATLMPLVWEVSKADELGTVYMHMARANKHWESISNGARALAIVHGPQAYISPSNYAAKAEHGKVVPTWNYQAIHFTGTVEVSHDSEYLLEIVSRLTNQHEATRNQPWQASDAPEDYLAGQLRGIVAITLKVDGVEAKAKLNQNRSVADQIGVVADLTNSELRQDKLVAELMKKNLGKN